MALSKSSRPDLLQNLEDYFCMDPAFTSAIGEFFSSNGSVLVFVPAEETQPLGNYDIFMKYQQLVEDKLTAFLNERGLTSSAVLEACQAAQANNDSQWLTCIDYLAAATEYESFMQLAFEHVTLRTGIMEEVEEEEEGIGDEE